jgi:hypothetical protein
VRDQAMRSSVPAGTQANRVNGWFAVFGYFLTSSIALLISLMLWLIAGIVITYREPKNAAKIIQALGHFPMRKR